MKPMIVINRLRPLAKCYAEAEQPEDNIRVVCKVRQAFMKPVGFKPTPPAGTLIFYNQKSEVTNQILYGIKNDVMTNADLEHMGIAPNINFDGKNLPIDANIMYQSNTTPKGKEVIIRRDVSDFCFTISRSGVVIHACSPTFEADYDHNPAVLLERPNRPIS